MQARSAETDRKPSRDSTWAPAERDPRDGKDSPTVDRIDLITGPSGALTGYSQVQFGDLNCPGPYNDPKTSGVSNVHQIHFHLDCGDSKDVTPQRVIQRSLSGGANEDHLPARRMLSNRQPSDVRGGFDGGMGFANDGPAQGETLRPSKDLISVADGPGIGALSGAFYPFIYKAHFTTTVAYRGDPIARARYDVHIHKKTGFDVPNTTNDLKPVEKTDLVRNRTL